MIDQFKMMGALAGLLKDKEKVKETADRVRATLEATRVEGSAGGGAVRVTVTGSARVESVRVDPALGAGFADDESRGLAEALVCEAVNDGLRRAREAAQAVMEAEAQEMGLADMLPGLRNILP
jgi:DNA-binding YbaB/EbfC family protein